MRCSNEDHVRVRIYFVCCCCVGLNYRRTVRLPAQQQYRFSVCTAHVSPTLFIRISITLRSAYTSFLTNSMWTIIVNITRWILKSFGRSKLKRNNTCIKNIKDLTIGHNIRTKSRRLSKEYNVWTLADFSETPRTVVYGQCHYSSTHIRYQFDYRRNGYDNNARPGTVCRIFLWKLYLSCRLPTRRKFPKNNRTITRLAASAVKRIDIRPLRAMLSMRVVRGGSVLGFIAYPDAPHPSASGIAVFVLIRKRKRNNYSFDSIFARKPYE